MSTDAEASGPDIDIHQSGPAAGEAASWAVSFEVENRGPGPVQLVDAMIPHPKYRAAPHEFGSERLEPGTCVRFDCSVAFSEAPGDAAENAFVILRVVWRGQTWRVLQRLTVRAGPRGEPTALNENMTAHVVGFAGD